MADVRLRDLNPAEFNYGVNVAGSLGVGTTSPAEELHVVTGAFGYTGRWIAHQLLNEGKRVRTLTNDVGRDDPSGGRVAAGRCHLPFTIFHIPFTIYHIQFTIYHVYLQINKY